MVSSSLIVITDRVTDTQTDKSDHNTPSHFMWRGKKKKKKKKKKQNHILMLDYANKWNPVTWFYEPSNNTQQKSWNRTWLAKLNKTIPISTK